MNHQLLSIGILIILVGFAIVVIGSLTGPQKGDTKVAVGGFIGFIPFGFANDKRFLWAGIGLSFFILVFYVLFRLFR